MVKASYAAAVLTAAGVNPVTCTVWASTLATAASRAGPVNAASRAAIAVCCCAAETETV